MNDRASRTGQDQGRRRRFGELSGRFRHNSPKRLLRGVTIAALRAHPKGGIWGVRHGLPRLIADLPRLITSTRDLKINRRGRRLRLGRGGEQPEEILLFPGAAVCRHHRPPS
jgi:hypothetical protein